MVEGIRNLWPDVRDVITAPRCICPEPELTLTDSGVCGPIVCRKCMHIARPPGMPPNVMVEGKIEFRLNE